MSVTSQTNDPQRQAKTGRSGEKSAPLNIATDNDVASTRLEARKVQRIIHHISPWSVLKVSLLFYLCVWLVVMVAGVILWQIANGAGLIDSFESFMAELLAEQTFDVYGSQILRLCATFGIVAVVAGSALTVLFTVIFNLISDITGGIRLSVVELETARPVRRRSFRAVPGGKAAR